MPRRKLALLILSALVALSVAYVMLYVEPQQDYLIELDFRRLAAMVERIDMQLATYQQIVTNATRPPQRLPLPLVPVGVWKTKGRPPQEPEVKITDRLMWGRQWFLLDAEGYTARLPVDHLVHQAFELASFDKLIFAASDGHILYQEGRADIQVTTVAGLGIDGISDDKDIKRLSRSSGLLNGEISGNRYKIFVRPCLTRSGPQEGWVLYALVSSPRFHLRPLKVSANWVILFFGFALLLLLALPFLKLLTLGKGSRLRAIDGLLAGLCALIGLSVLTVLLLDQFVYKKLEKTADDQMKELAQLIHTSFIKDLDRALTDLATVRAFASSKLRDAGSSSSAPEAIKMKVHTDFFWVDKEGMQIFKWTQEKQETPLIDVRDRAYFRDALEKPPPFSRPGLGVGPFALESVRSWTTGEDVIEIATPDTNGRVNREGKRASSAAAVLTTRMGSVHEAVLPPGLGFAIIDSMGKVLLHSDPSRTLQENFLKEAGSRDLESLVAAGRAGKVKIHYMGLQHKAFLEPFSELPWSVVTFRDMTLLRATNVQIVTTSLVCLVLYATLFLALFSFVYIASSTRARWLWPAASRQGGYLQLAVFYAGCLLAQIKLLRDGDSVFLLINGMVIPLFALFVSYLKIRADQNLFDEKQKASFALILTLLAASLTVGKLRLEPRTWHFALIALVLGGMLLFLPPITRFFRQWRTAPLRATYLSSAALLLMVLTIIPATSFFKLACDLPIENMLKLGQRRLIGRLGQAHPYISVFFGTTSSTAIPTDDKNYKARSNYHLPWLMEWQEDNFPVYSDNSRELARLSPDTANEWPWYWEHRKKSLSLHWKEESGKRGIYLKSLFPVVRPEGWWEWLSLGLGILVLGLISLGLVWLMADNLMLLGTGSPLWLNRRKIRLGSSASHLVYVSYRPGRLRTPADSGSEVIDLAAVEEAGETRRILERLLPTTTRLIIVRGFEHRLEDRGFNWAKLKLLEALIRDGRQVILLSTQDPYLCLASNILWGGDDDPDREQEERERWSRLLARFVVVDLDGRPQDAKRLVEKLTQTSERLLKRNGRYAGLSNIPWSLHVTNCLHTVREECSPTTRLQEIGMRLMPHLRLGETNQREILKEILTRAEVYYEALWNSLLGEEKLVLLQLAEEGLTNPRNLRPLQRLIARGMVRRDPAPRLMNETFRLFVIEAAAKEGVHQIEIQHEKASTWVQLQAPLTATLIGGMLFFGFTQQDMFKTTLTLITALAGALPHLLQLVGYIGTAKGPGASAH